MNLVQVSDQELMEVDGGNRRRRAQARRSSYSNREPISWSEVQPYVRNAHRATTAAIGLTAALTSSPAVAVAGGVWAVAGLLID